MAAPCAHHVGPPPSQVPSTLLLLPKSHALSIQPAAILYALYEHLPMPLYGPTWRYYEPFCSIFVILSTFVSFCCIAYNFLIFGSFPPSFSAVFHVCEPMKSARFLLCFFGQIWGKFVHFCFSLKKPLSSYNPAKNAVFHV